MLQTNYKLTLVKNIPEIQKDLRRTAMDLGTEVTGGCLEELENNEVVVHLSLKGETWQQKHYGKQLTSLFEEYLEQNGKKMVALYVGGFTI